MKKVLLSAAVVAMVALSFTSCSVEKRHYMKGYHIEWFGNKNEASKEQASVNTTKAVVAEQAAVASQEVAQPASVAPVTEVAPVQKSVAAPVAAVSHKAVVAAKAENNSSVAQQAVSSVKAQVVKQAVKKAASQPASGKPSKGLLILLAILIPWLAVGLATDWDVKAVVINLLWSLTCIGGIIHAIIVVNREA